MVSSTFPLFQYDFVPSWIIYLISAACVSVTFSRPRWTDGLQMALLGTPVVFYSSSFVLPSAWAVHWFCCHVYCCQSNVTGLHACNIVALWKSCTGRWCTSVDVVFCHIQYIQCSRTVHYTWTNLVFSLDVPSNAKPRRVVHPPIKHK